MLREILGVFLNTLAAHAKYPVQDWNNLQLPIQMQLSEKRKTFSQIFLPVLECTSNFKYFRKSTIVIANVFPKLQTVKIFVRLLCKKPFFRTRFDNQHVKVSQILARSQ